MCMITLCELYVCLGKVWPKFGCARRGARHLAVGVGVLETLGSRVRL